MRAGRVDVIIPTYNGARLLSETLDSVLAQTYPGFSVTVVDDGSTDRTPDVVHRYRGRVAYLRKDNGGQASARNLGCRSTDGDYVCFVDSDDLLLPNMLEVLVGRLSTEPRLDLCYAKVLAFDGSDALHPYAEYWRPFVAWPRILEPLTALCAIHGSAALMRRGVFARYGGLPEGREFQGCEDWYFWLTLALGGAQVAYVPSVLALYRHHMRASSSAGRAVLVRESTLMRAMVSMFAERGLDDARSRHLLALGTLGLVLRWIPYHNAPAIASLTEMARSLRPNDPALARLLDGTLCPGGATEGWLRLAQGYLTLGIPELAAACFNRCWPDGRSLRDPLLDRVSSAMEALVRNGVAAHCLGDASYLGHTARVLSHVRRASGDMRGREEQLRHAKLLDPNELRNDLQMAATRVGQGAYVDAVKVVAGAFLERPFGVLRASSRATLTRARRLLRLVQ